MRPRRIQRPIEADALDGTKVHEIREEVYDLRFGRVLVSRERRVRPLYPAFAGLPVSHASLPMNESRGDSIRVMHPLLHGVEGGSTPTSPLHARTLRFEPCAKRHAVRLVMEWHSRLPNCQMGPWQFAFHAAHEGVTYAVALWNTPSGRCLPSHWLELRRMACSPDAPKNTASRFLAWMVRYFKTNHAERERCISYQDTAVHTGTIYKAAGWSAEYVSKPRIRDRSGKRTGTARDYRWNVNGIEADASAKVRWECPL